MEGVPNGYIEDDNIRELEGSRTWETGGLLNEGAVIKKMENGKSQLILTDEQIARMKVLDEKYSVEKSKKLENEPLRDLSGKIEVLSDKERTKQILVGVKGVGAGVLLLGLGIPICFAGAIDQGIHSVKYGVKIVDEAIKGRKFIPPEFI